jgi:hypothetical protein
MASTVLFICPHGAGKSRIAAAWFNANPAPGWTATTAGITPQPMVSAHAARLLMGTPALAHLDHGFPRPLGAVPEPALVVAIDCPPTTATDARRWALTPGDFSAAMAQDLRNRVEALVRELSSAKG